jgi:hypothetical protein
MIICKDIEKVYSRLLGRIISNPTKGGVGEI